MQLAKWIVQLPFLILLYESTSSEENMTKSTLALLLKTDFKSMDVCELRNITYTDVWKHVCVYVMN